MDVTFASLVTATGIVVAAGIVTTLVELLKAVLPTLSEKISGALLAFTLTALLYIATAAAVGVPSPDAGLNIFLAWLACSTSAVGIKSAISHARTT